MKKINHQYYYEIEYDDSPERTPDENLRFAIINRAILDLDYVIKYYTAGYKYSQKQHFTMGSKGSWQRLHDDLSRFFFSRTPKPNNLELLAKELNLEDSFVASIRNLAKYKLDYIEAARAEFFKHHKEEKAKVIKQCAVCHRDFVPLYAETKTCSKDCKAELSRELRYYHLRKKQAH